MTTITQTQPSDEPSLEALLADSGIRALMQKDGQSEDHVRALVTSISNAKKGGSISR